jgi:hypothetical protein
MLIMTSIKNKLFLNDGQGGFDDISVEAGIDDGKASRSMVYGDYDNDGDLDIFVAIARRDTTFDGHYLLYRNDLSNSNKWLSVALEGLKSNRDGFGAHIKIYVDGESWLHEVDGGSSYRSQHQTAAHFGLGSATKVDSLQIIWPGGNQQSVYDIEANQSLIVLEDTAVSDTTTHINELSLTNHPVSVVPNPNSGTFTVDFYSNGTNEITLKVFDLQGRVLYVAVHTSQTVGNSTIETNIEHLNTGLYILQISQNGKSHTSKILINGQ